MAPEIIPSQYMEGDRKESLTAIPEPSRMGSGGYPSLDPSRFPRPRRGRKLRRPTRRPRMAWPGAAPLRPPLHSLPLDYQCRLSPPVAVGPCALGLGSRWQTRRSRRPRRRKAALPASATANLNEKLTPSRAAPPQTARAMGTSMVVRHWHVGTASCDQGCQRESAALSPVRRYA